MINGGIEQRTDMEEMEKESMLRPPAKVDEPRSGKQEPENARDTSTSPVGGCSRGIGLLAA